jgi:hypothetical protein
MLVAVASITAAERAIRELNGSQVMGGFGNPLRVEFPELPKSSSPPGHYTHTRESARGSEVIEKALYQPAPSVPPHLMGVMRPYPYFPSTLPPQFRQLAHMPPHTMLPSHMPPLVRTHPASHTATVFVGGLPNHASRHDVSFCLRYHYLR